MARSLVTALALVAVLASGLLMGCERAPDDEMVVPSVTETAAPRPPTDLPGLPVGKADLPAATKVQVSGTVVTAGGRVFDITPMHLDEHVVAPGGIYFLNDGELWFTDLVRVVPTQFMHVRDLTLSADRKQISFIDLEHGARGKDGQRLPVKVRYDAATGKPLGAKYLPS